MIKIKYLIQLTKPGIIAGNLFTVVAGLLLAIGIYAPVSPLIFLCAITGIALVIASGCAINNYIDRDIDSLMQRTCNRVLAQNLIPSSYAISYGAILGVLGIIILYYGVNVLATAVALCGWFVYVVLYSMLFKRRSIYGTHIGSIAGAIPPLVGYFAISNQLDQASVILFFMLAIWQMPHSFAIALYRLNDYKAANIAVLPLKAGIERTKINILIYIIFFTIASLSLYLYGYASLAYYIFTLILCIYWLVHAYIGFFKTNTQAWAKKNFLISISILMIISSILMIENIYKLI